MSLNMFCVLMYVLKHTLTSLNRVKNVLKHTVLKHILGHVLKHMLKQKLRPTDGVRMKEWSSDDHQHLFFTDINLCFVHAIVRIYLDMECE